MLICVLDLFLDYFTLIFCVQQLSPFNESAQPICLNFLMNSFRKRSTIFKDDYIDFVRDTIDRTNVYLSIALNHHS